METLKVDIDRCKGVNLRVDDSYAATHSQSDLARLTLSLPPKELHAFAFDFFGVSASLCSSVALVF
jgi:hypothetical protein